MGSGGIGSGASGGATALGGNGTGGGVAPTGGATGTGDGGTTTWVGGSTSSGGNGGGGGSTGGVDVGGAPAGGTTMGSGGGSSSGGSATGGTQQGGAAGSVPVEPLEPRQAYDGARGVSFNADWRFQLGDVSGAEAPAFDDGFWAALNVPHDWSPALGFNRNSPGGGASGFMDGGVGWYRKTFTLDSSHAGKRILIEFDGVYMNSEVWVNGTSLGTWPYGYTTFQYDLTPYVMTDGSENVVAVRVDNKQPNSRWYTGSGIYRNVWLTVLDPVHIAYNGGFVTTPSVSATSATVAVSTEIENSSTGTASVEVRTSIYDAAGALVVSDTGAATSIDANGETTVTQELTVANPRLWSIASPTLYQARIELLVGGQPVDTYAVPIGLRWTRFDPDTGFYLNDEPVKIWGTCLHHDLGALGSAVNVRALERQLEILKGMGSNGIRTSHNPPTPEFLDLADRMGFVVMDEAFDVWETGKEPAFDYHIYFNDWAQRDLQAFVRRDRNHPSVIMWSIGNEIGGATVETATRLRDWVKAIDPTRPVTWGANHMQYDAGHRAVAAILDLQGYNYFVGDANVDTGDFQIDKDHRDNPDWVIFGSEELSNVKSRGIYYTQGKDLHWTGCDGSTRLCSSYDVGWGDGFNTEEMYLINTRRPFFFGQFDWTGFDYGGEPTPYPADAKSSYFGIVDTAGFPKDIYYFYQSKLTTDPMVHILPHWNWTSGTTVWVWAYSNCDSVELFLNGSSLGEKPFSSAQTTRLEWDVPWEAGTLRAEGKRAGTVVATQEIETSGEPDAIELTADRSQIRADARDLVFVTADIQDQNGVFVPTATNPVTFEVSGPGRLAGVDNGDQTDFTGYTSPTRNAFSGKVLAIVQSTGSPGPITVTANAPGLTQGTVSVMTE